MSDDSFLRLYYLLSNCNLISYYLKMSRRVLKTPVVVQTPDKFSDFSEVWKTPKLFHARIICERQVFDLQREK